MRIPPFKDTLKKLFTQDVILMTFNILLIVWYASDGRTGFLLFQIGVTLFYVFVMVARIKRRGEYERM